jgi:hypothetical protein
MFYVCILWLIGKFDQEHFNINENYIIFVLIEITNR